MSEDLQGRFTESEIQSRLEKGTTAEEKVKLTSERAVVTRVAEIAIGEISRFLSNTLKISYDHQTGETYVIKQAVFAPEGIDGSTVVHRQKILFNSEGEIKTIESEVMRAELVSIPLRTVREIVLKRDEKGNFVISESTRIDIEALKEANKDISQALRRHGEVVRAKEQVTNEKPTGI